MNYSAGDKMLKKASNILAWIVLGSLVAGLLYLVLMWIGAIGILGNEAALLKKELKNPYINTAFEGWRRVTIRNWDGCMFPEEWSISDDGNVIHITDQTSKLVAQGTVLGAPDSAFENREEFLTEVLNFEVTKIHDEHAADFTPIHISFFGEIKTIGAIENSYYFLTLKEYDSTELFLIFSSELEINYEDLKEIAQAIVYSYNFP